MPGETQSEWQKMGGASSTSGEVKVPWLTREPRNGRERYAQFMARATNVLGDATEFYGKHASHIIPEVVETFGLPPQSVEAARQAVREAGKDQIATVDLRALGEAS